MTAEQESASRASAPAQGDDLAAIKAEHACTYDSRGIEWCPNCYERWPCLPYRLAMEVERGRALGGDVARVSGETRQQNSKTGRTGALTPATRP